MFFWTSLERFGDKTALVSDTAQITYAELAKRADEFARHLRTRLPDSISRPLVALEAGNEVESIVAYVGALRAGWPVILLAKGQDRSETSIIGTYRPNIVFHKTTGGWTTDIDSRTIDEPHRDLAILLSTSGTTGASKLVRLSNGNIQANAVSIAQYLDIRGNDVTITALPFHYSYGMSVINTHLLAGAQITLTELSLVDTDFWALAKAQKVTSLALVPTQFEMLDRNGFERLSALPIRYVTQAGGRLDPHVARKVIAVSKDRGWRFFIMYGQTEAAPRMSYVPPEEVEHNYHTIGRPIPGGRLYLVNAAGEELDGTGVPGELVYEGANVMMGYATARDDLALASGPLVLRTGDVAERIENGFYRIVGRASRFIKIYGLRIGLDQVESSLRDQGYKVYASGSDELLVLFVHGADDYPELHRKVVRDFKLTDSVVDICRLASIPLLESGKVDYRALREIAAGMVPRTDGQQSILDMLKSTLRTESINSNFSFREHGGDSLAYLEMQLFLSRRWDKLPTGWEDIPVSQLLKNDNDLRSDMPSERSFDVSADLVCRVVALLAVIALHSTDWPTGGGAYLLLMIAGYSLARFQSSLLFEGKFSSVIHSMLLPIFVCYAVVVIAAELVRGPINREWFFLAGNFIADFQPQGMTPYWFICAYIQIVVLFALPFLIPQIRRFAASAPYLFGLAALAGVALMMQALGLDELDYSVRHRHPVAALELLVFGWCMYFSAGNAERIALVIVAAALFLVQWQDLTLGIVLFIATGSLAVIFGLKVPVPLWIARGLMLVGSLAMFCYVAHVPVVMIGFRLVPHSDLLRFLTVVPSSLAAGYVFKRAYEVARARMT